MNKKNENALNIVVQAKGDLRVQGWRRDDLEIQYAHGGAFKLASVSGTATVECPAGAFLSLPEGAAVQIAGAQGNVHVESIEGGITAGDIAGNVDLRRVGTCRLSRVNGNLHASEIAGGLMLESAGGAADLDGVEGSVEMRKVEADLHVREVRGSIKAAAGGNAYIALAEPAYAAEISAKGALHADMPATANAAVTVLSEDGDIRLGMPGGGAPAIEDGKVAFTMGSGGPAIRLESGTAVSFVARAAEPAMAFGEHAAGVRARVEEIKGRLYRLLEERRKTAPESATEERDVRLQRSIDGAIERLRKREEDIFRTAERRRTVAERRGGRE